MASAVAFRGSCRAANARSGKRASRAPLVVRATAGTHPRLRLDCRGTLARGGLPARRDASGSGPGALSRPLGELAQQPRARAAQSGAEALARALPRVTRGRACRRPGHRVEEPGGDAQVLRAVREEVRAAAALLASPAALRQRRAVSQAAARPPRARTATCAGHGSGPHPCTPSPLRRSGTYFCVDKSVTAVVIQGLAEHKDTLGAPLCPCRHYDDKEAEAAQGFWNCPCVPMRERKVRRAEGLQRRAGLLG
jgi:hypothetical protein